MGFLNDLVNLTQVQFFIKYWWLWLLYVVFIYGFLTISEEGNGKDEEGKYNFK